MKGSVYCKSPDDVLDIFTIYIDASYPRNNFTFPSDPSAIGADVTRGNKTYILMSKADWEAKPDAMPSSLE